MLKFVHLTFIATALIAVPVFSQTDRPADMSTTARADDRSDDGFNMGWLGLVGLAGLAGMRRKAAAPVTHTTGEGSGARIYPSKT